MTIGFPGDLCGIDYSEDEAARPHRISLQAQRLSAHYVEASRTMAGAHLVRFADPSGVKRPSGMSGGAAFRVIIDADCSSLQPFHIAFAGIITNAAVELRHRMWFCELREVMDRLHRFFDTTPDDEPSQRAPRDGDDDYLPSLRSTSSTIGPTSRTASSSCSFEQPNFCVQYRTSCSSSRLMRLRSWLPRLLLSSLMVEA